jgi:hypothetical protein
MLLPFAYLAFSAVLRLLVGRRRSEVVKDVELLVLRHQLAVLGREKRVGFANSSWLSARGHLARFGALAVALEGGLLVLVVRVSRRAEPVRAVWMLARPCRSKELEILVLRHRAGDAPSDSPLDVYAPGSRSAATRVVAAHANPAAWPGEPALGIQTDRRRTQGSGHLRLRDLGAESAARGRSPAGAGATKLLVASVPAAAGGERARLRLPHRRDGVPEPDLRSVLHLAGDTADRVHRRHVESLRALGHPAGTQPDHAARRPPALPISDP